MNTQEIKEKYIKLCQERAATSNLPQAKMETYNTLAKQLMDAYVIEISSLTAQQIKEKYKPLRKEYEELDVKRVKGATQEEVARFYEISPEVAAAHHAEEKSKAREKSVTRTQKTPIQMKREEMRHDLYAEYRQLLVKITEGKETREDYVRLEIVRQGLDKRIGEKPGDVDDVQSDLKYIEQLRPIKAALAIDADKQAAYEKAAIKWQKSERELLAKLAKAKAEYDVAVSEWTDHDQVVRGWRTKPEGSPSNARAATYGWHGVQRRYGVMDLDWV